MINGRKSNFGIATLTDIQRASLLLFVIPVIPFFMYKDFHV